MATKTVLVVDDEIDILDSVEAVLEIDGYSIKRCSDPMKAIDLLKSLRPDILILDVMMPLKTGPEILLDKKEISEIARIPTILMSAGTSSKYEKDEYKWDIYMKKPFDLEELLNNVKKLL